MKIEQSLKINQKSDLEINKIEKEGKKSFISRVFNLVKSPEFIKQGIQFAIVGAIGTLVNLSILYIFTEIFNLLYLFSEAIAFIISVINNYIFNKIYTFKEDLNEKIIKKGVKFTIICFCALIVNLSALFILVEYFRIFYILAEVFAIVCAFSINFMGNRFWTFRNKTVDKKKKKSIYRFFIGILLTFWLFILGLTDLIIGILINDLIFILLGIPLLIVSFIITFKLVLVKHSKKNKK